MSGARRIEVVEDVAGAAAQRIAAVAAAGGHIALSGGSTPRAAYERLAELDVDWSRATLWFGDERCVAPSDERSNYAMVRTALLDRLGDPGPDVRRMAGEMGPSDGAGLYGEDLRSVWGDGMPALDLVLLGLGPDRHTASLFPGRPEVEEAERPVVGVPEPGVEPRVARITLTIPAINASREALFLVAGQKKAEAVADAFTGTPGPDRPASLVAPAAGGATVLLDAAAAALLPEEAR